jgi:hypothetical protein
MFDSQSYYRVLASIVAALTTLLGSVGIFVSLTVQRRVEKLQDILEEFLDLSYHSDTNITGTIYKLIEKYQMHYLFPDTPGRTILQYINLTIGAVVLSWAAILAMGFKGFREAVGVIYLFPLLLSLGILVFYRYLLKNAIYPFGNNMMSPLIPPPVHLRSVSFLSRYVNVSVKSILRQARLRILIKNCSDKAARVILKELSFDDYFYYMLIKGRDEPVFVSYGEVFILFRDEPVTGKPIPVAKNVNIPMGYLPGKDLTGYQEFEARFFIFPRGEKHPIEYIFSLIRQGNIILMSGEPEISVNYMVTYHIEQEKFQIIEENADIPFFRDFVRKSVLDKKRYACSHPFKPENVYECEETIYID